MLALDAPWREPVIRPPALMRNGHDDNLGLS
jgi:hypothetical protein